MSYQYEYSHWDKKTGRTIWEHQRIAEEVLGKKLPPKAEVHHLDGNGTVRHKHAEFCPARLYSPQSRRSGKGQKSRDFIPQRKKLAVNKIHQEVK